MIVALALLLAGADDPRIPLAELQLQERHREALVRVETELVQEPDAAADLGFHYLRGHLLEELGRRDDAQVAFRDAMQALPELSAYSLFRLASNQFRLRHPEVAAGLLARLLGGGAPGPLLRPSTDLLIRAIDAGGDCRLLDQVERWNLTADARRSVELTRSDCLLRSGQRETARGALLRLLEASNTDDPARAAAVRLNQLVDSTDRSRLARSVGMAFYQHRLFDLSTMRLGRVLGNPTSWQVELQTDEHFETLYALARSNFWNANYIQAASQFGQLAAVETSPERRGRALYQQGRCYELSGNWTTAAKVYRLAYLAEPAGRWADAGLMSALRVEWRTGKEESALELYELLGQRRNWRPMLVRASLFLSASDLVRGRADRARAWLSQIARDGGPEVSYWLGRLAELNGSNSAIDRYLDALTEDAYHPLSRAALRRLAQPALVVESLARARRLAGSNRTSDLYASWLVLGDERPEGVAARERLEQRLAANPQIRPFLEIGGREPAEWPIWGSRLTQPEELLLSLGVWDQGASVVLKHFPVTDPSLAYTGGRILARANQTRPSIYVGEILSKRMPAALPPSMVSRRLQETLYPLPYRELIVGESERWGIDPLLLAALIREESRFDPQALSSASARGLTQMVLPTAHRLAQQIGFENLEARDLHSPPVSIALGAAYVAELISQFGNSAHMVLAAYNAGEDQTRVWRSYCYSREPEEFYSKVGFNQTRNYLRKVLSSREHYAELYSD